MFLELIQVNSSFSTHSLKSKLGSEPVIHGQIDLIKFVESNKFDNVYSKIWNIFAWWNQFYKVFRI